MKRIAFVIMLSFILIMPAFGNAFYEKNKMQFMDLNKIKNKMPLKTHNIFIQIILKLLGFDFNKNFRSIDEIDQTQENHDAYYKIDSVGKMLYQSFVPTMPKLTKIELYLGKHFIFNSNENTASSLSVEINTGKNSSSGNFFDEIKPKICVVIMEHKPEDLNDIGYSYIWGKVSKWVYMKDVPENGGWVTFYPKYGNYYLLRPGDTYYICIETGGWIKSYSYFKWYYGYNNPYKNGEAGGDNVDSNVDFAFRTYGSNNDGVVNKYAVLVGVENSKMMPNQPAVYAAQSAIVIKNALLSDSSWKPENIKLILNESATVDNVTKAIKETVSKMDGDDILMLSFSSHGGDGKVVLYDREISTTDINHILLRYDVNAFIAVCTCHSGWWTEKAKHDGRVIVTSSAKDEDTSGGGPWWGATPFDSLLVEALSGHFLRDGVDYDENGDHIIDKKWHRGDPIPKNEPFYPDFNRDGYVSAEEAYHYIDWWYRYDDYFGGVEHPQISDGYPYLNNNSEEMKITYIGT